MVTDKLLTSEQNIVFTHYNIKMSKYNGDREINGDLRQGGQKMIKGGGETGA